MAKALKNVFIRTVTNFYVGEVAAVNGKWIRLKKAAWVTDTGRFSEAMATGKLCEVECYPPDMVVNVAVSSVVDFCEWPYELPTTSV